MNVFIKKKRIQKWINKINIDQKSPEEWIDFEDSFNWVEKKSSVTVESYDVNMITDGLPKVRNIRINLRQKTQMIFY